MRPDWKEEIRGGRTIPEIKVGELKNGSRDKVK